MNTVKCTGTSLALIVVLLNGCSASNDSQRPQRRNPQSTAAARPTKQSTLERFVVDIVSGDRSQMRPAQLPPSGQTGGMDAQLIAGPPDGRVTRLFASGDYIITSELGNRVPLRLSVFGLGEALAWSIDDSSVADLASSGRESVLTFKMDGTVHIKVLSGESVVFRLKAVARTFRSDMGTAWRAGVFRIDQQGNYIDMFGDVSSPSP